MALLLGTNHLSKSYGMKMLFRDISINFDDGQRVGLIGANGSGKSTLLKILAGLEHADEGEITTRRQLRVAYLAQEDVFAPEATVLAVVAQAAPQHDQHDREIAASILLGKIGFSDFEQRAETLSGGWRKRLAIAREAITNPDLLLLDEPTNHLDVEGIEWLEKFLTAAQFTYVLVSHDRYFLENTCNRTVELNRAFADGYLSVDGSYSELLEKRQGYLDAQQSRQTAVASRVRREVEWLRRGAKARTTKAKGRIEEAGKLMDELADLKDRNTAAGSAGIDFAATERKTRKLLACKRIAKSLGGKRLFSDLSLVLSPGTKLGLLGPNGSGKTTLINLLSGEMEPDAGQIVRADVLRTVVFDQRRARLDKDLTLRRALSPGGDNVSFAGNTMHVSGWAQRFLFRTEQLDLPVSELSGGEQARVVIANIMLQPADLLILDEPTNDLDIPTLLVLEESLLEFPGALVLVTHDRYMLDRLCTDLLALDGKGGAHFFATLEQWRNARREAEIVRPKPAAAAAAPVPRGVKLTYMEQRELEQIEGKIEAAEANAHRLQSQMSDAKVLADHEKLAEVCHQFAAAQEAVHTLYARWETLEKKREKSS